MKKLLGLVAFSTLFLGCSNITMLRTAEIQEINDGVRNDLRREIKQTNLRLDSLKKAYHTLDAKFKEQKLVLNRLKADVSIMTTRIADESVRNDTRQEEILYRLDMLLGKSDKILSKKVVVSGASEPQIPLDSLEKQANLLVEMEIMFNTARSDFLRGEYKIAFDGFKQVYEQIKTGELAEESLYWMSLCLVEVDKTDKAKVLLNRLVQEFPEGNKICVGLFKLAGIAAAESNITEQKQFLQILLEKKQCMETNEFIQGAEMLEELLNQPEQTGVPDTHKQDSTAQDILKQEPPQALNDSLSKPAAEPEKQETEQADSLKQ